MISSRPGLSERLLCFANYLGAAPLTRLWRSKRDEVFFTHHFTQAMAVLFCLASAFIGFYLLDTVRCLVFIAFPQVAQQVTEHWVPFLRFVDYALWLPIIALATIWIMPMVFALCGSTRQLPLLKQLARRSWIIRLSLVFNTLILASIPIITVFAIHATSLTRTSHDGASVYFLYDEGVPVPRWVFTLGMYRITLQADRNWRKESTVVDHLNRANLRTALASGRVVILATHGQQGYAVTYYAPEYLCVGAPDTGTTNENNSPHFLHMKLLQPDNHWGKWENVAVNDNLKLAYLFACHGGEKASQWEEHLSPARVITYNRISTVYDHAWWFAFTGPKLLAQL